MCVLEQIELVSECPWWLYEMKGQMNPADVNRVIETLMEMEKFGV